MSLNNKRHLPRPNNSLTWLRRAMSVQSSCHKSCSDKWTLPPLLKMIRHWHQLRLQSPCQRSLHRLSCHHNPPFSRVSSKLRKQLWRLRQFRRRLSVFQRYSRRHRRNKSHNNLISCQKLCLKCQSQEVMSWRTQSLASPNALWKRSTRRRPRSARALWMSYQKETTTCQNRQRRWRWVSVQRTSSSEMILRHPRKYKLRKPSTTQSASTSPTSIRKLSRLPRRDTTWRTKFEKWGKFVWRIKHGLKDASLYLSIWIAMHIKAWNHNNYLSTIMIKFRSNAG